MCPVEFTLLPYYLSETISLLTVGGAGYLGWRLVRAYERRSVEPQRLGEIARRVQMLEATVQQVEEDVCQTVEAQRFTTALLFTDRALERRSLSGERAS